MMGGGRSRRPGAIHTIISFVRCADHATCGINIMPSSNLPISPVPPYFGLLGNRRGPGPRS